MPKNIVICSDGTGNAANKDRGTNVFKLYEAIDIHGAWAPGGSGDSPPRQIAYYEDGVGTGSLLPVRLLGMMFGLGLASNVRNLYCSLARVYEPGDQIYLFGFSRGAFTVRTLAGFILCCGLPVASAYESDADLRAAVGKAFRQYRKRYRTFWQRAAGRPNISQPGELATVEEEWGRQYAGMHIRFIGVWDTVDAVGMPFDELAAFWDAFIYPFRFPDRKISPRVQRACHAISVDDERKTFHPTMWNESGAREGQIEQVWFPGVHSNVGGGYPKQGMSLIALDWMMAQAELAGLRFLHSDRVDYRDHRDPHDKLYDPRAGLAVYYRWKPRDIGALCQAHNTAPKIHVSVIERIAQASAGYAPGGLPANLQIVGTPGGAGPSRLAGIQQLVAGALSQCEGGSLLAQGRIRSALRLGRVSYYSFLLLSIAAVILGLRSSFPELGGLPLAGAAAQLAAWVREAAASPFATIAAIVRQTWHWLVPGMALAYGLSVYVDRTMERCYSSFWHRLRPGLRELLRPEAGA